MKCRTFHERVKPTEKFLTHSIRTLHINKPLILMKLDSQQTSTDTPTPDPILTENTLSEWFGTGRRNKEDSRDQCSTLQLILP